MSQFSLFNEFDPLWMSSFVCSKKKLNCKITMCWTSPILYLQLFFIVIGFDAYLLFVSKWGYGRYDNHKKPEFLICWLQKFNYIGMIWNFWGIIIFFGMQVNLNRYPIRILLKPGNFPLNIFKNKHMKS